MSEPAQRGRAPRISLLAAVARNGVIGRDNALPWRLPEDLKRFRRLTLGHPVVMGRKTYESIIARNGKPLPGRDNIVLTRAADYRAPGCTVSASIDAALRAADPARGTIYVIGGAAVFRAAMPLADRLDLTEIHADVPGDTFFPGFDRTAWREVARQALSPSVPERPQDSFAYDFVVYDRVRPG